MRKIKTFVWNYLLAILIFCVMAGMTFYFGVMPLIKNNNIMKNGAQAEATVLELVEANAVVNNEPTYCVQVEFVNGVGDTVRATSIDYLSLDDSQDIYDRMDAGETVTVSIRYINSDVIVGTSLNSMTSRMNTVLTVVSVIMVVLALIFAVMLILTWRKASGMNQALLTGEQTEGNFVKTGSVTMAMGNRRYVSVTYEFINADGILVSVKSPRTYLQHEAELLRFVQSFPVRTYGKYSVIAFDFDNFVPVEPSPLPYN